MKTNNSNKAMSFEEFVEFKKNNPDALYDYYKNDNKQKFYINKRGELTPFEEIKLESTAEYMVIVSAQPEDAEKIENLIAETLKEKIPNIREVYLKRVY